MNLLEKFTTCVVKHMNNATHLGLTTHDLALRDELRSLIPPFYSYLGNRAPANSPISGFALSLIVSTSTFKTTEEGQVNAKEIDKNEH